ncbi:MAG: OPT/YSL family transporter [Acidobacteria bacterium]|nr:OPT/YSL family transporter [Acidobacteriota bacterium]
MRRQTLLPLIYSVILGMGFGLANVYIGLKLGFTVGVALLTVFVLGGSVRVFRAFMPKWPGFDAHQYVYYQSLTSAMSYGAGNVLASAFAAMVMSHSIGPHPWLLAIWLSGVCALGCVVTVPMRARLLASYPFPSGRIAGESVQHLLDGKSVRVFFSAFGLSGFWVILQNLVKSMPTGWSLFRQWGVSWSPMLLGLGAILGLRTCLSLLVGAVVAFEVAPVLWAQQAEVIVPWTAVTAMCVASIGELFLQIGADKSAPKLALRDPFWWRFAVPLSLIVAGLSIWVLHASWLVVVVALGLIVPFAWVSNRVTGETDVVPTGALGKLSLLLLGLLPGAAGAMVGTGVLAGSSSASSDFMTDLRCGQIHECDPKRQFRYQFAGAILGPLIFVPVVWFLIMPRFELGGDEFPAPAGQIWLNVWQFTQREALFADPTINFALGVGLVIGVLAILINRYPRVKAFAPSLVVAAFAAFLDQTTVLTLLAGAGMGRLLGKRVSDVAIAMVAGESVFVWVGLLAAL